MQDFKLPGELAIIPAWAVKLFVVYSAGVTALVFLLGWLIVSLLTGFLAAVAVGVANAGLGYLVARVLAKRLEELKDAVPAAPVATEPQASQYSAAVDAQNARLDQLEQQVELLTNAVAEIQDLIEEEEPAPESDQPQWFEQNFPDPDEELYPADEETEEEEIKLSAEDSEDAPAEVKPHWSEDQYPDPDKTKK